MGATVGSSTDVDADPEFDAEPEAEGEPEAGAEADTGTDADKDTNAVCGADKGTDEEGVANGPPLAPPTGEVNVSGEGVSDWEASNDGDGDEPPRWSTALSDGVLDSDELAVNEGECGCNTGGDDVNVDDTVPTDDEGEGDGEREGDVDGGSVDDDDDNCGEDVIIVDGRCVVVGVVEGSNVDAAADGEAEDVLSRSCVGDGCDSGGETDCDAEADADSFAKDIDGDAGAETDAPTDDDAEVDSGEGSAVDEGSGVGGDCDSSVLLSFPFAFALLLPSPLPSPSFASPDGDGETESAVDKDGRIVGVAEGDIPDASGVADGTGVSGTTNVALGSPPLPSVLSFDTVVTVAMTVMVVVVVISTISVAVAVTVVVAVCVTAAVAVSVIAVVAVAVTVTVTVTATVLGMTTISGCCFSSAFVVTTTTGDGFTRGGVCGSPEED